MARRSQTSTAILGALSIEPLTGYEIRQAITSVLGHFWHESYGQIYPCLTELEADGLVSSAPGDRAHSSRFAITPRGRRCLRQLLAEAPVPQPPRNGVLLRTFFGEAMAPQDLTRMLDTVIADAHARLASYAGIRDEIARDPRYPDHGRYWEATVRAGELSAQAQITWATETRAALDLPA